MHNENEEESREKWEQELADVQRTVTFDQGLRSVQIIAKKLSVTPAPIPDFAHLLRYLLSGVFLVAACLVFSSELPHKMMIGSAILAASLFIRFVSILLPHPPHAHG